MELKFKQLLIFIFLSLIIFFIAGCGSLKTNKDFYLNIDQKAELLDFNGAANLLEYDKDDNYGDKDDVLYCLDMGMLYHYAGEYEKSNEMLTKAENDIEDLYTKSITKAVGSILLNDNALDYFGEDYENIYLNVFKSLNYLHLGNFEDAFVEIRRVNEKLSKLEVKYKNLADEYNKSKKKKVDFKIGKSNFHDSALARLLSLLFYRSEGRIDDARIDLEKVKEAWETEANVYNNQSLPLNNYLDNTSKAKIDFISFIGRSPEKYAKKIIVHSETNLILLYLSDGKDERKLDAIAWPGITKGLHLKFAMPYIEKRGSEVARVEVIIKNNARTNLYQFESIENVAVETFKIKEPIILIKAITRTVIKALLNEAINKELDKKTGGGIFGSLTRAITGAAFDATENADLRISHYFPSMIYTGELEVDPGKYDIKIRYFSNDNRLIMEEDFGEKYIGRGKLNLLESCCLQ